MSKTNNIYQNKDPKAKFQIDRECRWFYEGTEIKRHAMVCLFSRYLKRDDNGAYNIVTPYECVAVGVEHAPFKKNDFSALLGKIALQSDRHSRFTMSKRSALPLISIN